MKYPELEDKEFRFLITGAAGSISIKSKVFRRWYELP